MRAIWRSLTAAVALALVIDLISFTLPLSAGHANWDQKTTPYAITAPTRTPAPMLTLDPISTDGSVLLDSSGRTVILRGFRTIIYNTDYSVVDYTLEDYQRMKSLGANYQSIRVLAPLVGALPGETASPYYMDKLDSMMSLAKQAGLYTEFKLTMWGTADFDWTDLWLNENGEQDAVIAGWKNIWERYKDETAVIGYDLIGEPQKGNLSVGDEEFVSDYLTPFYQEAIDELRKIDDKHLVLFEPALKQYDYGFLPYNVPISREQVAYAPHFYPYMRYPYWTGNYAEIFERYANEARMHNAPLLIGEYGVPWSHLDDGNITKESEYQVTEKAALDLFDSAAVGFSRPWYADDRAKVTDETNWALIKGTSGLGGELRTFITDVFSRPYPRRTAGFLSSFGYDMDTKTFAMSYMPDSGLGETCIFVPLERQYGGAFVMRHSSGITLRFHSLTSSPEVVSNPGGIDPARFLWDETNQVLRISEWQEGEIVTIEIADRCSDSDGCYIYGTGCEYRDYYWDGVGCPYAGSDGHTDYYDDWVFYCSANSVRKHRVFHDFHCEAGACTDNASWVDDQLVEDCDTYDGWQDTGYTRWVKDSPTACLEKEQKEQEFRDYACSGCSCIYSVTDTQWVDTGNERALSYLVYVSSSPYKGGSVTPASGFYCGSIAFTASAKPGYEFINWTIDGVTGETDNPLNLDVQQYTTLMASFSPTPLTYQDPIRATELRVNAEEGTFQFLAPGFDSGVVQDAEIAIIGGYLLGKGNTTSPSTSYYFYARLTDDLCLARAAVSNDPWPKVYWLYDPPGVE